MEIEQTKQVWVAWTNTDLTEGRGARFPLFVAESREAAVRLGRGKSVQGSNCSVTEGIAVKIDGQWLVPGRVEGESGQDKKDRLRREAKEAALEKARAAGLTDLDLAALS